MRPLLQKIVDVNVEVSGYDGARWKEVLGVCVIAMRPATPFSHALINCLHQILDNKSTFEVADAPN